MNPGQCGKVHIYTGNGKGKTTAALGLALRAAGAGWTVFIGQFLKAGRSSEHAALKRLTDRITVEAFGTGRWVRADPDPADREAAARAMERVRRVFRSGAYRMVILDEALVAVSCGLVSEADLLELIRTRPGDVELVLTGRGATENLVQAADLVTEMREIRHYFRNGVPARTGVEK